MTYTIGRYPTHLIDVLQLSGGQRVVVRPTLPQDIEAQCAFFRTLSPQSRHRRFLTRLHELPDTLVECFGAIDYRNHVALLAEIYDAEQQTMVAEARYVVEQNDPEACEFAIAVADAWQMRGIGQALLARLEQQAAATGIRRMCAGTLVSNAPMRALARRAGYAATANREDAEMLKLEKVLQSPARKPRTRQLAPRNPYWRFASHTVET